MKQNKTKSCNDGLTPNRAQWITNHSRNLFRLGFLIGGLLCLAILVLPAYAQAGSGQVTDDDVNAIAKELYCPICESTPLDVCATQACADWRQVIRTKLGEGQTEAEIKAYFLDQYGPRALAEPPRSGVTLTVWLLPILALIVGVIILLRYFRKSRKATPAESVAVAPVETPNPVDEVQDGGDYRSRIESELRDMKR